MNDPYISADQDRYATSILSKYIDTVTVKTTTKVYNTNLPYDAIFTKYDVFTSNEQVEKFSREFNIQYRAFVGPFIYLLSKIVSLSFAVHNLEKFS